MKSYTTSVERIVAAIMLGLLLTALYKHRSDTAIQSEPLAVSHSPAPASVLLLTNAAIVAQWAEACRNLPPMTVRTNEVVAMSIMGEPSPGWSEAQLTAWARMFTVTNSSCVFWTSKDGSSQVFIQNDAISIHIKFKF